MARRVEGVTVVLSWALQGDEVQRWHDVPFDSFLDDVVSEAFLESLTGPGGVAVVHGQKRLQRPLHTQVRSCMGGSENCLFLGLVRTPSRPAMTSGGGQCDVDLPLSTVHRAEGFLAQFAAWMNALGYSTWTVDKEPGGHLTPFWLYARMEMSCPTKSQVQFGCTSFAAVNARTHAYARGKGKHLLAAVDLLQHFVDDVWTFEEQARGHTEPTHAHQHDDNWEELRMRPYICPSSEQVWFGCEDDPNVWFMLDTPNGRRSACGEWEAYQSEEGRVWWCCESSRRVFFPTAA